MRILAVCLLAVALVCCVRSGLGLNGLLTFAPALVLMVAMLAGRYPGERLLSGHAKRRRGPWRSRARLALRPRTRATQLPRGGLLMGFAMAVRPPPLAVAVS